MSVESAAIDLGEFLIALASKHELTYGEIVMVLREYTKKVEKHKAQFEVDQLKARYGK